MWRSLGRALSGLCEIAFAGLLALVAAQAIARPFPLYEAWLKPWLPGFCDVIFFGVALLAARDLLRDDPDSSWLARLASGVATAARRAPRLAEGIGIAAALVSILLVSLALFDRGVVPIDEGLHLYGASALLHGRQIYRDYVLIYPPGFFYLVAGIFSIFGESLYVMRVVSIGLQIALSMTLYGLVRKSSGSPLHAALAAALMLAFGLPLGYFLTTATWLALLFSMLALWALGRSPGRPLLAGVLAALAVVFKQDTGVFLILGLLVAALVARGSLAERVSRGSTLVPLVLPTAVATLATIVFLRASGVSFADQWACLVERPLRFMTTSGHIPVPSPIESPIAYLPFLFYGGAILSLVAAWRRREAISPAVVAATVFGLLGTSGYFARADLWHLAYSIPPAFVAAPQALDGLRRLLERAKRPLFSAAFLMSVLPIGFTLYNLEKYAAARARVAQFKKTWEPLQTERARGIYAEPYERGQIDGVAGWIQEKCKPGESFFVAPAQPIFYFLLPDRPPAAHFIVISPIFGTSPAEQAWTLDDLARNKPRVLLLNRLPWDGKTFQDLAPDVYRGCFEGREPEHVIGEFLSFPGMPE